MEGESIGRLKLVSAPKLCLGLCATTTIYSLINRRILGRLSEQKSNQNGPDNDLDKLLEFAHCQRSLYSLPIVPCNTTRSIRWYAHMSEINDSLGITRSTVVKLINASLNARLTIVSSI